MKLIERPQYLEKMIGVMGTPDIKVITGVRRSGKSKLLEMFKAYIEKHLTNAHIIHIKYLLPVHGKLIISMREYLSQMFQPGWVDNYHVYLNKLSRSIKVDL